MAANVKTGRVRQVRYCGHDYTVQPGTVYGRKQTWAVFCDGQQIAQDTLTRSKAVTRIHAHAVKCGSYPASVTDGQSYEKLVAALCN